MYIVTRDITSTPPCLLVTLQHGSSKALELAQRWLSLPPTERDHVSLVAKELRVSGLVGDRRTMFATLRNAFVRPFTDAILRDRMPSTLLRGWSRAGGPQAGLLHATSAT